VDHVGEGLDGGDSGVGDHDVEPSRLLDSLIDETFDVVKVGDVSRDAPSLAPDSFDLLDSLVDERLIGGDVVYDHVVAVAGEPERDGSTDTTGTTSDLYRKSGSQVHIGSAGKFRRGFRNCCAHNGGLVEGSSNGAEGDGHGVVYRV
jgi:hypothetical protein